MRHRGGEAGRPAVLVAASVASMIDQFNMPNIRLLLEMGYAVHVACNFREGNTCDGRRLQKLQERLRKMHVVQHQWDCPRSMRPVRDCVRACRQLEALAGRFHYAWMHCHSPVGGALARIAAHRAGVPVVYTAHGFHFYRGAPAKNWLLYYPAEKLLSHWTDVLITVNREDYRLARRNLAAGRVCYIPGIGIQTEKFAAAKQPGGRENGRRAGIRPAGEPASGAGICPAGEPVSEAGGHPAGEPARGAGSHPAGEPARGAGSHLAAEMEQAGVRKTYGIPEDAVLLLSVGELSRNKNHKAVITALAALADQNVYYIICGQGVMKDALQQHAGRLGAAQRVILAGYREDPVPFYREADIFVFPSLREGMPVALMEAMAAGLPCVVSDVRGNRELISRDSMRFSGTDQLQAALEQVLSNETLRRACGQCNKSRVRRCDISHVMARTRRIYMKMGQKVQLNKERGSLKPVRVLHVLKTSSFSGAENVAVTICRHCGDGYQCAYASPQGTIQEWLREEGIAYYPMASFNYWELRRVLKQFGPDIVHAHDFTASVFCAMQKRDFYLLSHLHNDPPWIKKWALRPLAYWIAEKKIDRILLVSDAVRKEAVFLQKPNAETEVTGNPVDAARIRQMAEEGAAENYDVLFAGRLAVQKDPEKFIRIIAGIRRMGIPVRAAMLGAGELEEKCRIMIRQLGMEECIVMKGFCTNPYAYIRQAKLLLMPSRWEGYGLAAAEALLLGTPVLASPAGGLRGILRSMPQALCTSEEAFIRKASRLLMDQCLYERFRSRAMRAASMEMPETLETYMRRMRELYDQAVQPLCRG